MSLLCLLVSFFLSKIKKKNPWRFLISGAILLSLYYLFLWDPYKNTKGGQNQPTKVPYAQSNSPATPTPSMMTTPATPPASDISNLSEEALDSLVDDLNHGAQPKALALAIKSLKEQRQRGNFTSLWNPDSDSKKTIFSRLSPCQKIDPDGG